MNKIENGNESYGTNWRGVAKKKTTKECDWVSEFVNGCCFRFDEFGVH